MSTTPDKLVERYLKHLDVELDDLPRDRRREIVDEIAGHIAEARAALEHESEADVRNLLEGLGDPADIAADARYVWVIDPDTLESELHTAHGSTVLADGILRIPGPAGVEIVVPLAEVLLD